MLVEVCREIEGEGRGRGVAIVRSGAEERHAASKRLQLTHILFLPRHSCTKRGMGEGGDVVVLVGGVGGCGLPGASGSRREMAERKE